MSAANAQGPSPIQNTLKSVVATEAPKGHPKGLYFLFFTEMWERFGYYGMRALLMLYMTNYLLWSSSQGFFVYKWYTSLVYLTPLAGGFIADRVLGLRFSVVAGGILMAIGYFTLSIQSLFYPALLLIILGNGFFKPNISTMVGKMYRAGDTRRDGAFTIFYMGINMGALFAPLVCGTLAEKFAPKYGFIAAAVGMVVGVTVFLLGQRRINADVAAAGNELTVSKAPEKASDAGKSTLSSGRSEDAEPGATGAAGVLAKVFPLMMIGLAVGVPVYYGITLARGQATVLDAIMPIAFALISGAMGFTLLTIKGASRDRSSVIFVLFLFAVLFWMAFEQAGSALNIWADVHTDRALGSFTYPASWWQSANAVLIVALAPVFAALWTWLGRRGKEPSTPMKMFLGLVFMVASFGAMVAGAASENSTQSRVALDSLPAQVKVQGDELVFADKGDPLDATRMRYDAAKKELVARGVISEEAVNEALERTAPPEWAKDIAQLDARAKDATKAAPVTSHVTPPPSFAVPFDEKEQAAHNVTISPSGDIALTAPMDPSTKVALVSAAAPPEWRQAVKELAKKSNAARVSGFWLLLSYLLATLGELCLSPVGLSMVTKLAPARFASLFMGVWLLASSLAQYLGGAIGESMWGTITPASYFTVFVWSSAVGVVVLAVLVRPLRKLMHQVH